MSRWSVRIVAIALAKLWTDQKGCNNCSKGHLQSFTSPSVRKEEQLLFYHIRINDRTFDQGSQGSFFTHTKNMHVLALPESAIFFKIKSVIFQLHERSFQRHLTERRKKRKKLTPGRSQTHNHWISWHMIYCCATTAAQVNVAVTKKHLVMHLSRPITESIYPLSKILKRSSFSFLSVLMEEQMKLNWLSKHRVVPRHSLFTPSKMDYAVFRQQQKCCGSIFER